MTEQHQVTPPDKPVQQWVIRPGDTVILRNSSPFTLDRTGVVDRVTKTQVVVGSQRFRISDGLPPGRRDRWSYWRIIPATPDAIAETERQQQIRQTLERACQLVRQIEQHTRLRECPNIAAAIPHLEAALAALNLE